jgi:hypothetical protein
MEGPEKCWRFEYVARNRKGFIKFLYFLLVYSLIWLNLPMDDSYFYRIFLFTDYHHFGLVTRFLKKTTASHYQVQTLKVCNKNVFVDLPASALLSSSIIGHLAVECY